IEKKVKSAVTDSGSEVRGGPEKEGIGNLVEILAAVRDCTPDQIEAEFAAARYGEFKEAVAQAVTAYLAPVRERYETLRPDEQALESVLADGAGKAREIAAGTLRDGRDRMGVGTAGGG